MREKNNYYYYDNLYILTWKTNNIDYHLEIHGKNETIWNVTYSTWGPNNMDGDLASQYISSPDSLYVTPVHNSSILALSTDKRAKKPARWVGSVPSMVVSVFDVLKSTKSSQRNEPLMLLPQPQDPNSAKQQTQFVDENHDPSGTYIEKTKDGQWFALSGQYFPSLVGSAPIAKWCNNNGKGEYKSKEDLYQSVVGVHPAEMGAAARSTTENYDDNYYSYYGKGRNYRAPGIAGPAPPLGIEGPPTSMVGFRPQPDSALDYRRHPNNNQFYNNGQYYDRQRPDQASKPSPLPIAPPPPGRSSGPSNYNDFYISPWWNLVSRLLENLVTLAVVAGATVAAARFGWLPQLTELIVLLNSRQRSNSVREAEETITGDVNEEISKTGPITAQVETPQVVDDTNISNDDKAAVNENAAAVSSPQNVTIIEPEQPPNNNNNQEANKSPEKKRRKRGSRGGKKNKNNKSEQEDDNNTNQVLDNTIATSATNGTAPSNNNQELSAVDGLALANIEVDDDVIGLGSHGTVVFKGRFAGRPAAIKRMVMSFCDIASQEVNLLQESDDHPNVIRYYSQYQNPEFLYIALELCPCTLEQVIETPFKFQEMTDRMDPKDILKQMASGLKHLHMLGIVHRDIKPQNILVAPQKRIHAKKNSTSSASHDENYAPIRIVISDFGLCKKLEYDQSSFRPTTAHPAGTAGWIAPEIDRQDMKKNIIKEQSSAEEDEGQRTKGDSDSHNNLLLMGMDKNRRLTRAVDIFSLGCVFYYILSHGDHPFGENQRREINIEEHNYSLSALEGDDTELDTVEARDLITQMISHDHLKRPKINDVLLHPYFWSSQKKLDYLIKVSDWIESEGRTSFPELLEELETEAPDVIGEEPWFENIDKGLIDNLQQYRKYQHRISDLLRALRNKSHHYNELPSQLQEQLPLPHGFLRYFTKKYPLLLLTIYYFGKKHLTKKMSLKAFFEEEKE